MKGHWILAITGVFGPVDLVGVTIKTERAVMDYGQRCGQISHQENLCHGLGELTPVGLGVVEVNRKRGTNHPSTSKYFVLNLENSTRRLSTEDTIVVTGRMKEAWECKEPGI